MTSSKQMAFDFQYDEDPEELDFSESRRKKKKKSDKTEITRCEKCGSKLHDDEKEICNDCLDANSGGYF